MDRITEKQLEALAKRINEVTGNPTEYFTPTEAGPPYHSNIGNYHIDHAYGRVALEQTMNESGGVRRILGSGTKRELWNEMHAFLSGLSLKS